MYSAPIRLHRVAVGGIDKRIARWFGRIKPRSGKVADLPAHEHLLGTFCSPLGMGVLPRLGSTRGRPSSRRRRPSRCARSGSARRAGPPYKSRSPSRWYGGGCCPSSCLFSSAGRRGTSWRASCCQRAAEAGASAWLGCSARLVWQALQSKKASVGADARASASGRGCLRTIFADWRRAPKSEGLERHPHLAQQNGHF